MIVLFPFLSLVIFLSSLVLCFLSDGCVSAAPCVRLSCTSLWIEKITYAFALQGIVTTLKDGYGFIRCMERDASMFFRFSELLNQEKEVKVQDEVRFTVAKVNVVCLCEWLRNIWIL